MEIPPRPAQPGTNRRQQSLTLRRATRRHVNATLSKITFIAPWCCHGLRRNFYMPYFQDEWKVTPTFTLTAGLRWEYYGVAHEATNRTTVFDLNQFHGVCLGSGSFNVAPNPGPDQHAPCPTNPALYNAELQEL